MTLEQALELEVSKLSDVFFTAKKTPNQIYLDFSQVENLYKVGIVNILDDSYSSVVNEQNNSTKEYSQILIISKNSQSDDTADNDFNLDNMGVLFMELSDFAEYLISRMSYYGFSIKITNINKNSENANINAIVAYLDILQKKDLNCFDFTK